MTASVIRGHHTRVLVETNTRAAIAAAIGAGLDHLRDDGMGTPVCAVFASSRDLDASFPAAAARAWGLACAVLGVEAVGPDTRTIDILVHAEHVVL